MELIMILKKKKDWQTGSGAHLTSYSMDTRSSFPRVKRPGVKLATHLLLVPRSGMRGVIPTLPQYVFMAWYLLKLRDNFIFTLINSNTM